jgi:cell wall-associated NlpC family hydrolase
MQAAAAALSARVEKLQHGQPRLAAVSARLIALRNQAEAMVERYNQAVSAEQRAAKAYRAAKAALAAVRTARRTARARGTLQAGGSLAVNTAVRKLTRQTRDLLHARQADAREVRDLRQAVQALAPGQLTAANAGRSQREALAVARARRDAQRARRQAALAATAMAAAGEPRQAARVRSGRSGASLEQGYMAAYFALSQLGKPYQWGGAGPYSYDCSGLAMQAWARAGVQMGHYTGLQWNAGPHVPLDQLQPGDLVFYASNTSDPSTIHHVGIYLDNGLMVDAPEPGTSVRIDNIYGPGLIGATRPAD